VANERTQPQLTPVDENSLSPSVQNAMVGLLGAELFESASTLYWEIFAKLPELDAAYEPSEIVDRPMTVADERNAYAAALPPASLPTLAFALPPSPGLPEVFPVTAAASPPSPAALSLLVSSDAS